MNPNELEVLLRLELSANRTVEWLMERIFNDESPDDAVAALKRLANQVEPENHHSLAALGYYRGMRWALDLSDLRWLGLDAPVLDTRKMRRECAEQYRRYRELFELEVAIGRRQKSAGMALSENWAGIESSIKQELKAFRFRLMLRAAGWMFSAGVPGALDLVDTAVFGMFRLLYLRPVA